MVELWEAIVGRRSVRAFTDKPIERHTLERLIAAAIWAPSGGNAQTWRFVAVTDPNRIRQIKMISPGLLGDPPALIVACQDMKEAARKGGKVGRDFLSIVDTGMAVQNLLLAAHAEGLGTCVVASFHRGAVKRLLTIPNGMEPLLIVTVGEPAEEPPAPPRDRNVLFFEVYDAG
ncbi:nitroreductase family protein [Candidatus Acetothermia bacterium]|nr:MAG: nitroreductase family protein [Candidatus Acetothermia bacterium]